MPLFGCNDLHFTANICSEALLEFDHDQSRSSSILLMYVCIGAWVNI
jgi:hypothetical protein